jgi:SAM-dependent methyltransferase
MNCRICSNSEGNKTHRAREMMFGLRDEFDYIECSQCGTVQIAEIPDLEKYYPPNYLSFDAESPVGRSPMHRLAAQFVGRYYLTGRGLIGKLLTRIEPRFGNHYPESIRRPDLGLRWDSRILDFGCGAGRLLRSLHHFGFTRLTGADAFIRGDIEYPEGVRILKRSLAELEVPFDLIMLHHSFEHLPEPAAELSQIRRLLTDKGACLIRVPVAAFAWEEYGTNWVQMDPPRHLYLFTEKAMRKLARKAGFEVADVQYDSTGFQFWGSEQYQRDIPLVPEGGDGRFSPSAIFTSEQLDAWESRARELNAEGRGDAACFYLKKARA